MPYTITDLDNLERAIAQGATTVKYGDKEVQYRTLNEMYQIRENMRDELGLNGADPVQRRRRYATFNKGLN